MSRAYLFSTDGEQHHTAPWYGYLSTPADRASVVAIRQRTGYRLVKLPPLPPTTIIEHVRDTRLSWAMLGPSRDRMMIPTIAGVRAFLTLGGEVT